MKFKTGRINTIVTAMGTLVLLSLIPLSTRAEENSIPTAPLSLFGYSAGMTIAEARSLGYFGRRNAVGNGSSYGFKTEIGGVGFEVLVNFLDDASANTQRCDTVFAKFKSDDFQKVVSVLIEKYGQGVTELSTVRTRNGVEYEKVGITWHTPTSNLTLFNIYQTVDHGAIFLLSTEAIKRFSEEADKKTNALKEGL